MIHDDTLWTHICADEDLMSAFREDPHGVARAFGVALSDDVLEAIDALEDGAVTDVTLERA